MHRLSLAGLVRDVVQVALGIRVLVIDGGGKPAGTHGLHAGYQLHRAGGRDQVPHHALDAANRGAAGRLPKHMLDRQGLDAVVDLGAGAVGIDITDLGWSDAGVLQRAIDAGDGSPALGMTVGHPEGVGGGEITGHLRKDLRAALFRVLQLLQNQHASPLTKHKSITLLVEGTGGPLGIGLVGGKGGEQIEPSHPKGVDHAVGPTGQNHVAIADSNEVHRLTNGLGTGCAGREAVEVGPVQPEMGRQMHRGGVQLLVRLGPDMESRPSTLAKPGVIELAGLGIVGVGGFPHQVVEIMDAFPRTEVDPHSVAIDFPRIQSLNKARRGKCLLCRRGSEFAVDAAVIPTGAILDPVGKLEAGNLGREVGGKGGGVEIPDWTDAGSPLEQGLEHRIDVAPERGDHTHPSDDNPALVFPTHDDSPLMTVVLSGLAQL